jgi:uncharacterized protein
VSRRQILWLFQGITTAGHLVLFAALLAFLPGLLALPIAAACWAVSGWRARALGLDPRRPRWVVRLVDEPVFWHWGACVLAIPLLVPSLALSAVAGGSPAGAALGAYLAALALSAWSVWGERRRLCVRRIELGIPGLGADLDGYRIVQLSDLHIGSFDPRERGRAWVDRANLLEADLAVVTGDLVTAGTHYYEDAAEVVGGLSARDGVFVCLGNHDQWDPARLVGELTRRKAVVLDNAWQLLRRGDSALVIAGLGDRYTRRDDLERTLAGRPDSTPTVLLAHYPESFAAAAERAVELVLSGHTHGGQIAVPGLAERLHIGAVRGQRGRGLVRSGASTLYVNGGLGTTGPPMRLGVPPEIALFVLRSLSAGAGSLDLAPTD